MSGTTSKMRRTASGSAVSEAPAAARALVIVLAFGLALSPAFVLALGGAAGEALAQLPAAAGRAGDEAPPQPAPARTTRVVASVFPLAAIAAEIGGEKATAAAVLPPGADPHSFELTPTAARSVEQADAIFLVGGHFDHWILGNRPEGSSRIVEIAAALGDSLIKTDDEVNPHIWLDPLLAKDIGRVIGLELARIDAANRQYYEARVAAFGAAMDSLNAAVKARLRKCGFKAYVAAHPAWTYFARRYGIREAAVLELTPEQEPSARWIARVLRTMKESDVRVVIAEEFSNLALANSIARDSGARVVVLDPIGGPTRPGRDSYAALINYNLALIEEAAGRAR